MGQQCSSLQRQQLSAPTGRQPCMWAAWSLWWQVCTICTCVSTGYRCTNPLLSTAMWTGASLFLCGYLGEIAVVPAWPAFAGGMAGWAFILFEIFAGEAGGAVSGCSEAVSTSFNNMRMIVTVGWSIYPLGYLFGYLLGTVDDTFLNVIYNIADFVNKIGFVLSCWTAAKSDSAKKGALLA